MDDDALREQVLEVKAGRLQRRDFVRTMLGLGLSRAIVVEMLASAGLARAQSAGSTFVPDARGGGGTLRRLMVTAPTLLNPRLAVSLHDLDAARIFYEPLASFDKYGALIAILPREIQSVAHGGVAPEGLSV